MSENHENYWQSMRIFDGRRVAFFPAALSVIASRDQGMAEGESP
jgi:hypothetical protein